MTRQLDSCAVVVEYLKIVLKTHQAPAHGTYQQQSVTPEQRQRFHQFDVIVNSMVRAVRRCLARFLFLGMEGRM